MPRYLTDQDIADFRTELCRVATERFARFGYDGVTMRQLAEALGCSPKTPYRYFKDKADILATVRAEAFGKFADALEAAVKSAPAGDPIERARRVGEAYHRFALKNWNAYRIMFDIDAPIDESHPDLGPQAHRAAQYITQQAEQLAKLGLIAVDPKLFGYSMWAATHGLVMLQHAGMLHEDHAPDYQTLANFHGMLMLMGAAGPKTGSARKSGKKR